MMKYKKMSESLKLHLPTYKLKDPDNIDHTMRSISLAAQQVNIIMEFIIKYFVMKEVC
jgi:hypothetical protein